MTHENRKSIFNEELRHLKNHNYIEQSDFEKVAAAYEQYYEAILVEEKAQADRLAELRKARLAEANRIAEERMAKLKLEKEKKKLTPEQVRERNISLSLIVGVILLLIGGLVLATSSWEKMNHLMKVLSIGGVSLLFFGISYIAGKYLKIKKTAFAFLTLASLLIPVTFVGIGYFQLFGEWLSLFGEGKYILGVIATLICFPLYTWIAIQNKNRLFIWLSLFTLTVMTGFVLAALYVPIDVFYLGMIVYNGLLLAGFHYFKSDQRVTNFIQELPLFTQANLIISTLLMLVFFQNHLLYSVNILLTAVMYIAIVFVYNRKEFHIVFTLLFVYGMYQLLENTFLQPLNYLGFALIGIIYILLEDRIADGFLKKVFRVTSGIVSGLAFLYISFEGLVVRADENSIFLLLAYLVIAINYIYLAFITNRKVFQFLAPIFLLSTGFQSWNLLSEAFDFKLFETYMFAVAGIMFVFLYVKNNNKYLIPIQHSSFYVAIGTMAITLCSSFIFQRYLELALLFGFFGVILWMTHEVHHKKEYQKIAAWLLPISWLLALRSFYEEYSLMDTFYMNEVGAAGHVALSSLLLLGISYVIGNYRERLFLPMFAIAISSYTLSLLAIVTTNVLPVLRSSFLLAAIIVYLILVYQTKNKQFWSLVSISTAALFLSLIEPLKLYENYSTLVVSLFLVPVILLIIYEFVGRKITDLKPYFFWTAHSLLVIIIAGVLVFQEFMNYQPLAFLIPLVIYTYSMFIQRQEWGLKLFLYSALTQIPIIILLLINYYTMNFEYAEGLAISTIIIGGIWGASRTEWKERVELFLLAIGMVSLVSFSILHQLALIDVGIIVVIAAFVIMLLFKRKWELLSILPLFFAALSFYGYTLGLEKPVKIVAYIIVVIILHLVGKFSHTYLFFQEDKKYQIDWFTIISPVFLFYIDHAILYTDPLWLKLIPYLLFVYLLYMQIGRVKGNLFKNIVMTATALSLLLPYYLVLDHLNVPELIAMEATMLPFIILTIFLSKKAWSDYSKEMNIIQTIVLVLVAVFIVGDAIESNTLNDAIIVGGLSLLSIIAGMHYRIKSYFFVGIAVLLLNVFLQTKPFWGNLPWWMYLIIGGATLIGFASFYEWQKQRPTREGKTLLQEKKEKFLKSFKDWK